VFVDYVVIAIMLLMAGNLECHAPQNEKAIPLLFGAVCAIIYSNGYPLILLVFFVFYNLFFFLSFKNGDK
tara:strand:- start:409 stop:618 length:210 start_codon:yes stop_codon:yes gene_type:complete